MSDADIRTVRHSYEALNEGDVEAALEALDPDAVWRDSPELPGGGEFRGREDAGPVPAGLPRRVARLPSAKSTTRSAMAIGSRW